MKFLQEILVLWRIVQLHLLQVKNQHQQLLDATETRLFEDVVAFKDVVVFENVEARFFEAKTIVKIIDSTQSKCSANAVISPPYKQT